MTFVDLVHDRVTPQGGGDGEGGGYLWFYSHPRLLWDKNSKASNGVVCQRHF